METQGIYATTCDVSSIESINNLIEFVKKSIGVVHYWQIACISDAFVPALCIVGLMFKSCRPVEQPARINNAGINGGRRRFTEISPEMVDTVVRAGLRVSAVADCGLSLQRATPQAEG